MSKRKILDIDDELEDKLSDEASNRLEDYFNSVRGKEAIELLDGSREGDGKLLYNFSSGRFYIKIYEYCIRGYGYSYSVEKENEGEFDINFISSIIEVIAINGNLEIYGEYFCYIIPNLLHIEMVDYITSCFVCSYHAERK